MKKTKEPIMVSKTDKKASRALFSAAFQEQLSAKFKLSSASSNQAFRIKTRNSSTRSKLPPLKKKEEAKAPQNYQEFQKNKVTLATKIEEEIKAKSLQHRQHLTLAQKLGIAPAPQPPLTNEQWEAILQKGMKNGRIMSDVECPICIEKFKILDQVILSCGHVFHRNCLHSLEKMTQRRVCPMCRKENYEEKLVVESAKAYFDQCATRIQAVFKRFSVQEGFLSSLVSRKYSASSLYFRRRIIGFKMKKVNDGLLKKYSLETKQREELLAREEHKRMSSEKAGEFAAKMLENYLRKNQEKVEEVLEPLREMQLKEKLERQGKSEMVCEEELKKMLENEKSCSICLADFENRKVLSVLSPCKHIFHACCIENLERMSFEANERKCPLCRGAYDKILFENNH